MITFSFTLLRLVMNLNIQVGDKNTFKFMNSQATMKVRTSSSKFSTTHQSTPKTHQESTKMPIKNIPMVC
ncbi:hypothetical protein EYC84_012011 [Monilinia fructicola]|uniref:Uncharacterized protein n=1 Tax=Monilinia fructicola TaxID=38448 RepID=A0A5M9J496_MONFR|nr:hypothetical protein EYC84_012011 [Monilinia fructicola]